MSQFTPVHEWGNGYTTQYSPPDRYHLVKKDGKSIGYAFDNQFQWAFVLDTGTRYFNSLPEGMERISNGE